MPRFLIVSLVASVVLTVVLNAALRLFPQMSQWVQDRIDQAAERGRTSAERAPDEASERRVQVWFPWKAMLVASVVLTVGLTLLANLARLFG